jgi:streptogramin lyase
MTQRFVVFLVLLGSSAHAGTVETIAGTGVPGFSGDGGPATRAQLHEPFHVELVGPNTLLIADAMNHRIRRLDLTTGRITTVAGNGQTGPGSDGGPAINSPVNTPYAIAAEHDGTFYLVEQTRPVVRRVDGGTGIITTLAGTGSKGFSGDGGPGRRATLREPNDAALDGRGGLLIADVADWRIRKVDLATETITTFAGTGKPTKRPSRLNIGDGGLATQAPIIGARAVCVNAEGDVFICEREGNAIRKINHTSGMITTIAGTGEPGYSGDGGPALKATFRGPKGLRSDTLGNLYVVDTENHAIRRIDMKTGTITTVAGGRKGAGGDGGEATLAGLDRPHGCVVAPDGTLYIADGGNHRIRRVRP